MVTLLLADTDISPKDLHKIENMCHAVGMSIMVHHREDDLDEIFDLTDSPVVVFTPKGKLTLEEMVKKYSTEVLLLIGGFTEEKDFDSPVYGRAKDTVSLGSEFLTIPEVIEQIIDVYEKVKH